MKDEAHQDGMLRVRYGAEIDALKAEVDRQKAMKRQGRLSRSEAFSMLSDAKDELAKARDLLFDWNNLYASMRWGDATVYAKTETFLAQQSTKDGE